MKNATQGKMRENKSGLRLARPESRPAKIPAVQKTALAKTETATNKKRIDESEEFLWQAARKDPGTKLAYSVREAADAIGVSAWYIRDEMSRGVLHYSAARGRQLIPRWELMRYLETNMDTATVPTEDEETDDPPEQISKKPFAKTNRV